MHVTVALEPCSDYRQEAIQDALEAILSPLGGLRDMIKPGQRVLLKPNLLSNKSPERCITTHPEVVRSMIRMLKQIGAKPFIADSPANVLKLEKVWVDTGMAAMAEAEGVPLISLEKSGSVSFTEEGISFSIAKAALEADAIINLPKLKTHSLTILSNAVKNMYGLIPGYQKTALHKQYPKPGEFGKVIAAVYRKVKPALTICDAVTAMDGNGPSGGTLIQLGVLAGSRDGVALDTVMCRWLGFDFNKLPCAEWIRLFKAGESDLSRIDVVGRAPSQWKGRAFQLPCTWFWRWVPRPVIRLLAPLVWVRPSFNDRCVHCGLCVKSCPVQALTLVDKQAPILDNRQCVECCCCHEICPENAVDMDYSFVVSLVRKKPVAHAKS